MLDCISGKQFAANFLVLKTLRWREEWDDKLGQSRKAEFHWLNVKC